MIESRLYRRFAWLTPDILPVLDRDWVEDEIEIMDQESAAEARRIKQQRPAPVIHGGGRG